MIATALIAAVNGKHFLFPVSRAPILEIVGLNTISVIVILGANVFLFIFIPRLSAFERHQNKSQQEETIMLRLYFFQVFNTVVASLILWDATQNSAGKADWPHWFADGGYFLVSVMIGDALLMNSIEYFRPFDMLIPRYITGPKVVTQQRLNRLYSLPSFSLGMRFQFVLKSATIALLFGSALPILYFVSAATLLLTYSIDKYLVYAFLSPPPACFPLPSRLTSGSPFIQVLRVYERPTSYNDRVATLASSVILPVCLLAHCFAGMCDASVALVPTANSHHACFSRSCCACSGRSQVLLLGRGRVSSSAVCLSLHDRALHNCTSVTF